MTGKRTLTHSITTCMAREKLEALEAEAKELTHPSLPPSLPPQNAEMQTHITIQILPPSLPPY